jgi:hypothetical protein
LRLSRLTFVALFVSACVSKPELEGRQCESGGECPLGLVCSEERVCMPLDASIASDAGTELQPDAGAARDAEIGADTEEIEDTGARDASARDLGPRDLGAPADGTVFVFDSGFRDASAPDAIAPDAMPIDSGVCERIPESCNGADDNCSTVADEGCPVGRVAYEPPEVRTTVAGAGGGVVWTPAMSCPDGQVVIGIRGRAGVYVDRLGERCGVPTVIEDRSVTPFRYRLEILQGASPATRGGTGGTLFEIACPANRTVTSLEVRSGSVIDQITITCSRFDLVSRIEANGAVSFLISETGPRTIINTPAGGTGGGPLSLACPMGYAASRLTGSHQTYSDGAGGTYDLVSSAGLSCTRLRPELR